MTRLSPRKAPHKVPYKAQGLRLTLAVSAVALLTACAVEPDPYSQAEFNARAAADRAAIFEGQEALSGPLTLEEALSRVLKYNLDTRAQMMEEALALGQTELDRFDLLPQITVNAGYSGRSENDTTTSRDAYTLQDSTSNPSYSTDRDSITADLGMTWNILDFGVSYFTAHQNADRALIAQERRRRTVQNLAQEVRFTFWRAAAAQVLRGKVQRAIVSAEVALRNAERVEAEGLRNPVESLRAQKSLLESIRQLEGIDADLRSAKAELAALINLPPGSQFTLDTSAAMTIPDVDLSIERLEELALANNPDLREQDYQSRITIDETRKEILRLLPGINFSVSRQYDGNSYLIDNRWNQAGATVTWNLLSIFSAPDRIDHAETAEEVAEAKRLALRMAVLAQVHVVSNQFAAAAVQYKRADRLWNIEKRLATATGNQSLGGTESQMAQVATQTSAIAAELRRYQAYALLQQSYGKLQATIGQDPTLSQFAAGEQEVLSAGLPQEELVKAEEPKEEVKAETPALAPVPASAPEPVAPVVAPVEVAPVVTETAAAPPSTPTQGMLVLTGGASMGEAERTWRKLGRSVPALRSLKPQMITRRDPQAGWVVVMQVQGELAEVQRLCASLKAVDKACGVVELANE